MREFRRAESSYITLQQPPSLSPLTFLTCRATRAASVKASFTPRFFIAEHSALLLAMYTCHSQEVFNDGHSPRYLRALIFSATASPCL